MTHTDLIARELNISTRQITSTISLLEEGATIPFISRYRKEVTGSLDETQVAAIQQQLKKFQDLDKRKETILKSIEEQGKLTDFLRDKILKTFDPTVLEDIYLPYKQKRKTKASVAKERGLEPLAKQLMDQGNFDVEQEASAFITEEVPDIEAALQGARDIISEWINEDENYRKAIRSLFSRTATIKSKLVKSKEKEAAKYRDYFDFEESLKKCPSHRLLAIRRGEDEGFLRVRIGPDKEEAIALLSQRVIDSYGLVAEQLSLAVTDAYKRLLGPGIETEFRKLAKEKADEEAINIFAENLRQLLLAPPLGQKNILALDPGFRTGCKLVCLNRNGDLLHHSTIFPHPPQSQELQSLDTIYKMVDRYDVEAIAIGNGTAGRETMDWLRKSKLEGVQLFMVNESGASIYSASEIAREEFPDKDLTVRGAVSIGRRLMDPLAELVKIDPKSIGVGQYQHDVNQSRLKDSLQQVVESCVNSVGINLNTASKHLLTYVSGLGPGLAQNIVEYRSANGGFTSRKELTKVTRMGDKAFEQCAGFLRLQNSDNVLDNTAVHPERYQLVQSMAGDLGTSLDDLVKKTSLQKNIDLKQYVNQEVGLPTLKDIMKELKKPGLDPRGEAQVFEFANVRKISDLEPGMKLPGIITNITKFGAFVDVGVKQDGLVHISQLADRFVKDPMDVVKLQQKVTVRVMEVDVERNRINLSMKNN